jgi:hypothetical protein
MPNRFRDITPGFQPSSTDCAEIQNSPVLVRTSANRERERGRPFVATKSNQIREYEAKDRNGPSLLATHLDGVDNDLSTALPALYVALQRQGQHTLVLSTCTPFATSANASSKRKVSEYTSKSPNGLQYEPLVVKHRVTGTRLLRRCRMRLKVTQGALQH